MRNVPDAPFPNKGLMQWSAKANGGFSSNAQPMYKIDKDFENVNYEVDLLAIVDHRLSRFRRNTRRHYLP